jgi:cell division initiation protein
LAFLGFRTSLFGFKKEDVNAYIEATAKKNSLKITELEASKKSAEEKASSLEQELNNLEEKYQEVKAKADYYSGKEEEIEKTSISIGTMYLVAKQNAAEILRSADECAKEIAKESKQRLAVAGEVDQKLSSLKEELSGAALRFSESVDLMNDSLQGIKARLEAQINQIENGETQVFISEQPQAVLNQNGEDNE